MDQARHRILVVHSNAKVQQRPTIAAVSTSPDAILGANVGRTIGSEFDVEDTYAVQRQHLGPRVPSVS